MTNSLRQFMQIRAMTFTPSDSPSMSPETMAILALQEDLAKPHPMSLALFMKLTQSINTLLCEHVIGTVLAIKMASGVATRFAASKAIVTALVFYEETMNSEDEPKIVATLKEIRGILDRMGIVR